MAGSDVKVESNGVWFCDECGNIFPTDELLKNHSSSEHPNK